MFQPKKFSSALRSTLLVLGIYLALRVGLAGLTSVAFNESRMHQASWLVRLLTSPLALWHYFVTFFYPQSISVAQDWAVTSATLAQFWLPLGALCLILGTTGTIALRWPNKPFRFFLIWSCVGLLIHSQILFPLDGTVADRWFYFPIIGFLGVLCLSAQALILRAPSSLQGLWVPAILLVIVALAAALATRSYYRTLDWESPLTLSARDLGADPNNFYLNNNLGVELFRQSKFSEALPYFKKATELSPKSLGAWSNLGATYSRLGREDLAEPCYLKSIQIGHYYLAYENYARLLLEQHRYPELKKFLETDAIQYYPNNAILRALQQKMLEATQAP